MDIIFKKISFCGCLYHSINHPAKFHVVWSSFDMFFEHSGWFIKFCWTIVFQTKECSKWFLIYRVWFIDVLMKNDFQLNGDKRVFILNSKWFRKKIFFKKNLKNQIWGFSLRAIERYQDTFDRPEAIVRIFAYQCAFFKGVCFMCRAVERWLHTFDRHVKRSKGDHLLSTGLRDGRKVDWVLSTASKEIYFLQKVWSFGFSLGQSKGPLIPFDRPSRRSKGEP